MIHGFIGPKKTIIDCQINVDILFLWVAKRTSGIDPCLFLKIDDLSPGPIYDIILTLIAAGPPPIGQLRPLPPGIRLCTEKHADARKCTQMHANARKIHRKIQSYS